MVLATANKENNPEAAVLEYGITDDLEIIFDTFIDSRKYRNIQYNNNVSLVIGWDEDVTVQYEGQAFELKGSDQGKYKRTYFRQNPRAKKWEKKEGISYFKVTPKWIRYSDLTKSPWEVFEITL